MARMTYESGRAHGSVSGSPYVVRIACPNPNKVPSLTARRSRTPRCTTRCMRAICLACPLLLLFCASCVPQEQPALSPLQRAQAAGAALQRWYVDRTGLYATTGWWNAANAVTALVDLMRVSGSRQYQPVLARTFAQAQVVVPKAEQTGALAKMTGAPGFLNNYYDDEGWWALAWIDAYDLTAEPRYLAMAQSIFTDMAGGWDDTCGGGIWWSKTAPTRTPLRMSCSFP